MVPFTAGSTIDILGRIVLDPLSRQLGQTIVIENRGGAGGSIGSAQVAKAEPDGYTLLINAAAHSAAPAAYPNITYDPAKDFAGVAMFGVVPNVFTVAPSIGHQDLAAAGGEGEGLRHHDLLLRRRRQRHALGGRALLAERRHQGDACAVPRRAGGAHRSDDRPRRFLLHRHSVDAAAHQRRPAAAAGGEHAEALGGAARRSDHTLEAGFKDSDYTFWNGMLVPAKTPRAIVDRLHAETMKALALPEVQAKLAPQGVEPLPLKPAEIDAMIAKEIASNLALAKAAGLKFN